MNGRELLERTTQRLILRTAQADDLPALLPVYLSNPDLVLVNEGSQGEPGHYDLEMFQRDWWLAQMTPGRHLLGVYLQTTGAAIGLADYLEKNPDDGLPWLGQLMIARAYQRQGYGVEVWRRLADHWRADDGWPLVRVGIARQNAAALAFCQRMGFRAVTAADADVASQRFVVLACEL